MSKKMLYVRNWQGRIISNSSFVEQESQNSEQPAFFMYEFLRSIARKQCRYPFQILKQYILFSEEESSIQVDYKHMRYQLELIQINITSVCNLARQKMLVDGFIAIKHSYEKKLRVEAAYGSVENIERIRTSITTIYNLQKVWLKWQVFGRLYQNYKGFKLSKINLSKIDFINNDYTSRELDEFQPFLDKQNEIQVINSFLIEKNSENAQPQQYQQNQLDQYQQYQMGRRRLEKRNFYREYEYKDSRLVSDRSVEPSTPLVHSHHQRQTEELSQKVLITHKKALDMIEAGSTNKHNKQIPSQETQYIYLIRDYRKREGTPSNFIKIPLATKDVKIVQIHTQKKKKRKNTQIIEQRVVLSEQSCENCKYCQQFSQRQEMMKKVSQRLEVIKTSEHRTSQLYSNEPENTFGNVMYQRSHLIEGDSQEGRMYSFGHRSHKGDSDNLKMIVTPPPPEIHGGHRQGYQAQVVTQKIHSGHTGYSQSQNIKTSQKLIQLNGAEHHEVKIVPHRTLAGEADNSQIHVSPHGSFLEQGERYSTKIITHRVHNGDNQHSVQISQKRTQILGEDSQEAITLPYRSQLEEGVNLKKQKTLHGTHVGQIQKYQTKIITQRAQGGDYSGNHPKISQKRNQLTTAVQTHEKRIFSDRSHLGGVDNLRLNILPHGGGQVQRYQTKIVSQRTQSGESQANNIRILQKRGLVMTGSELQARMLTDRSHSGGGDNYQMHIIPHGGHIGQIRRHQAKIMTQRTHGGESETHYTKISQKRNQISVGQTHQSRILSDRSHLGTDNSQIYTQANGANLGQTYRHQVKYITQRAQAGQSQGQHIKISQMRIPITVQSQQTRQISHHHRTSSAAGYEPVRFGQR